MALSKDLGKVGLTSGFPNSEQDRLDHLKLFNGTPTGTALNGTIGVDVLNSAIYQYNSTLGSWEPIGSGGSAITNTDQLPEGSVNLYFTTARARTAIQGSNSITYTQSTGIIEAKISNQAGNSLTLKSDGLYSGIGSFTTDQIPEGSVNLYFTTARARGAFTPSNSIAITSGQISVKLDPAPTNLITITADGLLLNEGAFIINQNSIDQAGNFRIGGIGRASKFTTYQTSIDPVALEGNLYSANSQASSIRLNKARGTSLSPSNVLANDNLGSLEFQGYNSSTSNFMSAGIIRGASTNIWNTTNATANLQFFVRNFTNLDKVMELFHDGSLVLPKITSPDVNDNFLSVDSSGKVTVVNLSTAIGSGFILNQNTSAQTGNLWITGRGTLADVDLTNLTTVVTPEFILSQGAGSTLVGKSSISSIISHFHGFQNMEDTSDPDYSAFQLFNGETATLLGTGLVQITMDSVTKKATIYVDPAQVAGVTSFNTRIGPVVPEPGDYDFDMLSGGLSDLQDYNTGVGPGIYNQVTVNSTGRVTDGGLYSVVLSGDVTGSGWPNIITNLKNSGVVAGTYNSVSVNSKGIVVSGTNIPPAIPNLQAVLTSGNTATKAMQLQSSSLTDFSDLLNSTAGLSMGYVETTPDFHQGVIYSYDFVTPTNRADLSIIAKDLLSFGGKNVTFSLEEASPDGKIEFITNGAGFFVAVNGTNNNTIQLVAGNSSFSPSRLRMQQDGGITITGESDNGTQMVGILELGTPYTVGLSSTSLTAHNHPLALGSNYTTGVYITNTTANTIPSGAPNVVLFVGAGVNPAITGPVAYISGRTRGENAVANDEYVTLGQVNGLYIPLSQKGAANGVTPLGADSKISSIYLPPLAITDTFVVNSQAAMLALTAQVGDVAVRTDTSETYILQTEPATTLSNWVKLATPATGVTSVGLSLPGTVFGISGSPVTSTGTLTGTFLNQSNNVVFASPDGASGVPSFRNLVPNDIPTLTSGKISDFISSVRNQLSQGTGISYNSSTGVISNTGIVTMPTLQQVSAAGNTTTLNLQSSSGFVLSSGGVSGSFNILPSVVQIGTNTNNDFQLYSNNSVHLTIKANGDIETVGNRNNTFGNNGVTIGYSGTDYGAIGYNVIYTSTTDQYWYRYNDYSSLLKFPNGGFVFYSADNSGGPGDPISYSQIASIDNSGSMVVGGGSPVSGSKLTVEGFITGDALYTNSGNDLYLWSRGGSTMFFYVGDTSNKMVLDNSGRLGIGTIPNSVRGSLLEVNGNVWSTDAYILGLTNTPIAEFGISGGDVFLRTMSTQNILFQTSADTIQGRINATTGKFEFTNAIKIGSSSTAGYVWTATDGSGNGSWQASSGGGATPTLDAVLGAGNTSDVNMSISGSFASDWAGQFINTNGTNGHGLYTKVTAGVPLRADIGATISFQVNAGGRTLLNNITDDGTSALQVSGNTRTTGTFTANTITAVSPVYSSGGYDILVHNLTTNRYERTSTTSAFAGETLHVVLGRGNTSTLGMQVAAVTSTNGEGLRLQNDNGFLSGYNNAGSTRTGYLQFQTTGINLVSDINVPLQFGTNGTYRMWLSTGGGLGIGTSSPSHAVHAIGGIVADYGSGLGRGRIRLQSGTGGHNYIYNDVSPSGDGTDWSVSGTLHLGANQINIDGPIVASSTADFGSNVAVSGTVTASGGFINSLRELKTDIKLFSGSALEIINQVKVNSFRYKKDLDNITYGLIVDEAPEEFLSNDRRSVNQYSMIGILMKSIQELNKRIDDVMGRIGQ